MGLQWPKGLVWFIVNCWLFRGIRDGLTGVQIENKVVQRANDFLRPDNAVGKRSALVGAGRFGGGYVPVPRVEDWPIMSAHRAGFTLMPAGFFSSNPAMGVPKTKP